MKNHLTEAHFLRKNHRLISALCLMISMLFLIPPTQTFADDTPTWQFDFRDCFYDIEFINKEKAVVIGARGRILTTHEKYKNMWRLRNSGIKELLTCLSFVDAKNGWAAGHGGVIIHTADGGETWKVLRQSSRKNLPLFDIWFVSPSVGYTCGAYDTFLKTTDGGKTWKSLPTGVDNIYNGLYFLDENNGYIIGEFGTVMRTQNGAKSWQQLNLGGYGASFSGITALSPKKLLVYGIGGKIMRSDDGGNSWVNVPSGVDKPLFEAAVNGNVVVIVGKTGTLLVSKDSGLTFKNDPDESLTIFAGICAHPDGGFMVVGERGTIKHYRPFDKD